MLRISPILALLVVALSITQVWAQTDAAAVQALRTARATYEQGRLQEIPTLLEDHLSKYNKTERIEAYRLLVLTYIYLEEPQHADKAMLDLLNTDHFFTPSTETDPAEFRNLYEKFRTKPIFAVGLRPTFHTTNVNVQKHYNILAEASGKGTYASKLNVSAAFAFEKDILKGKLVAAPELFYTARSFIYTSDNVFAVDNQPEPIAPLQEVTIAQSLLQLNIGVYYRFRKKDKSPLSFGGFEPYAGGGIASYMLLNSDFTGELGVESRGDDVSGPTLVNTENYKKYNFSAYGVAGMRVKVSELFITFDIRYYLGLTNVVNPENRNLQEGDYNEIFSRYSYINNDFSINNAGASIGFIYPIFKPVKLIK